MKNERIVIVGGPRRGKSTLALELRQGDQAVPIYCGDPMSKVKDPLTGVRYLPEGLPFAGDDGAAQWIADNWFTLPGPWVCEGHVMARALRRWANDDRPDAAGIMYPCDRIIVLDHEPWVESTKGQEAMHKGVMSVWAPIAHNFHGIVEYRTGPLGQRPVRIIDGQRRGR